MLRLGWCKGYVTFSLIVEAKYSPENQDSYINTQYYLSWRSIQTMLISLRFLSYKCYFILNKYIYISEVNSTHRDISLLNKNWIDDFYVNLIKREIFRDLWFSFRNWKKSLRYQIEFFKKVLFLQQTCNKYNVQRCP